MSTCYYRASFFSGPPPNLTKSQAHYKFLYLEDFRGGQFKGETDAAELGANTDANHTYSNFFKNIFLQIFFFLMLA